MSLRFSIATEAATYLTAVAARFGREGIVKELAMGRKAAPQRGLESLFDAFFTQTETHPASSAGRACARKRFLVLHRHPNLEAAIPGERIEVFVVTLEVGCIGGFQPGRWQPVIPDRVDGAANGRDVVAVG